MPVKATKAVRRSVNVRRSLRVSTVSEDPSFISSTPAVPGVFAAASTFQVPTSPISGDVHENEVWISGSHIEFKTPKVPSPAKTRRRTTMVNFPVLDKSGKTLMSPPGVKTRSRRSSIYVADTKQSVADTSSLTRAGKTTRTKPKAQLNRERVAASDLTSDTQIVNKRTSPIKRRGNFLQSSPSQQVERPVKPMDLEASKNNGETTQKSKVGSASEVSISASGRRRSSRRVQTPGVDVNTESFTHELIMSTPKSVYTPLRSTKKRQEIVPERSLKREAFDTQDKKESPPVKLARFTNTPTTGGPSSGRSSLQRPATSSIRLKAEATPNSVLKAQDQNSVVLVKTDKVKRVLELSHTQRESSVEEVTSTKSPGRSTRTQKLVNVSTPTIDVSASGSHGINSILSESQSESELSSGVIENENDVTMSHTGLSQRCTIL